MISQYIFSGARSPVAAMGFGIAAADQPQLAHAALQMDGISGLQTSWQGSKTLSGMLSQPCTMPGIAHGSSRQNLPLVIFTPSDPGFNTALASV
jgi:hypothetical protein